jgi:hypothetical protein
VPDLVAEVAEQGAVGLVHGMLICSRLASSASSTLSVIRPLGMPGHHLLSAGRRPQEVEHQSVLGVVTNFG